MSKNNDRVQELRAQIKELKAAHKAEIAEWKAWDKERIAEINGFAKSLRRAEASEARLEVKVNRIIEKLSAETAKLNLARENAEEWRAEARRLKRVASRAIKQAAMIAAELGNAERD